MNTKGAGDETKARRSLRIGFASGGDRLPGIGGHVGLFHMAGVRETGGRVVSIGYLRFDRRDLEPLRDKGIRLRVICIGVVRLGSDVSPSLAEAVLDIRLYGRLVADARTSAAVHRA